MASRGWKGLMVGPEEPVFSAMISQTHVALNKALPVEPQGIDTAPLCYKSGIAIANQSGLISMA